MGEEGGRGAMGGGNLMPPSPVICSKSQGCSKARSSQITLAIGVYFLVYSSSSS